MLHMSVESAIGAAVRPLMAENSDLRTKINQLSSILKKRESDYRKLKDKLDVSKHPIRAVPSIVTAEGRRVAHSWASERSQLLYRIEFLEEHHKQVTGKRAPPASWKVQDIMDKAQKQHQQDVDDGIEDNKPEKAETLAPVGAVKEEEEEEENAVVDPELEMMIHEAGDDSPGPLTEEEQAEVAHLMGED